MGIQMREIENARVRKLESSISEQQENTAKEKAKKQFEPNTTGGSNGMTAGFTFSRSHAETQGPRRRQAQLSSTLVYDHRVRPVSPRCTAGRHQTHLHPWGGHLDRLILDAMIVRIGGCRGGSSIQVACVNTSDFPNPSIRQSVRTRVAPGFFFFLTFVR